jgi:hypothetical protein
MLVGLTIQHNATGIRGLEARQHAQQGRFARAGATQKGKDLALVDVQADVVYRQGAVKALGDALDAEKYLRLRGGIVGHGHRQRPDFTLVQVRVIRRWAS